MNDYKIFILNSDGNICRAIDIAAASDEAILDEIARRDEPYGYEVWAGDRIVALVGAARIPESLNGDEPRAPSEIRNPEHGPRR
jgi:hypothetical protein